LSSSTASKLEALAGLSSAKRLIMRLSQGDIGVHAVLLYGVPGSGKHELARLLAEAWLCREPGPEGADGVCKACGAFARGNSADFLHIAPQGASRLIIGKQISKDKKSKEEDPISLLEFLRTMPLMSRHKVVLIEDAHRMNETASNSLLKTLEEPLPHGKLILTTDSVGGVRPTILSRCLAVACELPSDEELVRLAPGAHSDLIRMADGAPGRVRKAVEAPAVYERLARFARDLSVRPEGAALVASEEFRQIADELAKAGEQGARFGNSHALELLATFLAREQGVPTSWTQDVIEAHRRIQGNASATIVFDALFARILGR
jgi:DNA polymerase III subunit delta'